MELSLPYLIPSLATWQHVTDSSFLSSAAEKICFVSKLWCVVHKCKWFPKRWCPRALRCHPFIRLVQMCDYNISEDEIKAVKTQKERASLYFSWKISHFRFLSKKKTYQKLSRFMILYKMSKLKNFPHLKIQGAWYSLPLTNSNTWLELHVCCQC